MFPPEEQDVVRVRLAESLHAVVSQRLLPKRDGRGRAVACEVMIVTPTIRELMLDRDRVSEIRDYIAEGREQYGMQTFDQHLTDLVQSGEVEFEVALAAATKPGDFELKMRTFRRRSNPGRKAIEDPISEPMTGAISIVSGSPASGETPAAADLAKAQESPSQIQGLSTGFDF
jgi:twitching motility protein PilT